MPKGYWIAHVTVTNPDQYQLYASGTREAFQKYGATILARGGTFHQLEGPGHPRNVVIEFDSYQKALDCYNSDAYQAAIAIRTPVSDGDIIIIEGYEGPQPGD